MWVVVHFEVSINWVLYYGFQDGCGVFHDTLSGYPV